MIDCKPLISIIIPIYNSELFLDKTLNSVLNQNYKNIETILVNDGSTDRSEEICNSFVALDARFSFFSKQNSGANASRGIGVARAKGDYVYFLDSDDTIGVDEIEILVSELNNEDILIGGCKHSFLVNRNDFLKGMFFNQIPINLCANLYKRELLKEDFFLTGQDIRMGEDMLSNLMIAGVVDSIRGTMKGEYQITNNLNSVSRKFVRDVKYESKFFDFVKKILTNTNGVDNIEELLTAQKFTSLKFLLIENKNLDIENVFVKDLFKSAQSSENRINLLERCILYLYPLKLRAIIFRYYLLIRRKYSF